MLNNIDKAVLMTVFPIAKAMKASKDDVVVLCNRHIIIRSYNCRLAVAELNNDTGESFMCSYKNLDDFCTGKCEEFAHNYDMPDYYRIIDLYNKYTQYNDVIYSDDDIRVSHPEIFDLRSGDGYTIVDYAGHKVVMFAGILSVSKGDTVALDIYNGDNPSKFVIRYDLYKAKLKITISIYTVQLELR